jgi:hypothetical protein
VRDIYEVLKQKEADCARLRNEIEALRIVIPLMDEKGNAIHDTSVESEAVLPEVDNERVQQEAEAPELQLSEADRKGPLSSSLRESSWWRKQGSR